MSEQSRAHLHELVMLTNDEEWAMGDPPPRKFREGPRPTRPYAREVKASDLYAALEYGTHPICLITNYDPKPSGQRYPEKDIVRAHRPNA